jgi:hypothetical protein
MDPANYVGADMARVCNPGLPSIAQPLFVGHLGLPILYYLIGIPMKYIYNMRKGGKR